MKVLNYMYLGPKTKGVFEDSIEMKRFLKEGWKVIQYDPVEERYRMRKSAHVIVEVINDDLNLEVLELRDTILAAFGAKHLTKTVARKFFEEIENGKRELTKEKGYIRSYML